MVVSRTMLAVVKSVFWMLTAQALCFSALRLGVKLRPYAAAESLSSESYLAIVTSVILLAFLVGIVRLSNKLITRCDIAWGSMLYIQAFPGLVLSLRLIAQGLDIPVGRLAPMTSADDRLIFGTMCLICFCGLVLTYVLRRNDADTSVI